MSKPFTTLLFDSLNGDGESTVPSLRPKIRQGKQGSGDGGGPGSVVVERTPLED